jgi:membrane-bound lytic murein transglycosylase D
MSFRRPFFVACIALLSSYLPARLKAQAESEDAAHSAPLIGESVEIDSLLPDSDLQVPGTPYGEFKLSASRIVSDSLFPADSIVKERARFWFDIYCRIEESEGLVHDGKHMAIIYRRLPAPGAYTRAGRKWIDAALHSVQKDLLELAASQGKPGEPHLKKLQDMLPPQWDSTALVAAAERLRFQRGLKARFLSGINRSYRWLGQIESTMVARGLPPRLKYLPHVESSFQPFAYSKVGAAGMWQFMKSTGRRYGMKSSYLIDERRDPARSTDGAARLLRDAHGMLGSWPLALTAYNHGPGGMRKAVNTVGSRHLDDLIRLYESKSFGFASSNFYAEFLAASSIAMQADSLFPGHFKEPAQPTRVVELPKAMSITQLMKHTGLSPAELETHNLALRPTVFRNRSSLPKGTRIHLPETLDTTTLMALWRGEGKPAAVVLAGSKSETHPDKAAVAATPAPSMDKPAQAAIASATPLPQAVADAKPESRIAAVSEKKPETKPETKPKTETRDPKSGWVQKADTKPSATLQAAQPSGLARALDSAPKPEAGTSPSDEKGLVAASTTLADADMALQTAQSGDWVHPYDRFDPAVYHLTYREENGWLSFETGPEETLSHYSDWSGLSGSQIRQWNQIRGRRSLSMGRHLRVKMDSAQTANFIRRREENYRAVEEDFYGSYHVTALEPKVVTRGFSVWALAVDHDLPYWLLQKHNPNRDLAALHPGDTVQFPVVEAGVRRWGFTRYVRTGEQLQKMVERLVPVDSAAVVR